jgi:hypothetical protein
VGVRVRGGGDAPVSDGTGRSGAPRFGSEAGRTALDPARRTALADEVRGALEAACPGSRARLRGSLAAGTADPYSDIDVEWTVPAGRFRECVEGTRTALERVGALMSLRSDPDLATAAGRRLLFAAFSGQPLFWRLDLEVHAEPPGDAGVPDPGATDPWSPAASALANAVATVKALRRNRPDLALGLLERALTRVGSPARPTTHWSADIRLLAEAATASDPVQRPLAEAVLTLADEYLPN